MTAKPIVKIGIFGLGTVGGGVVQLLQTNQTLLEERLGVSIQIAAIVALNVHERKDLNLAGIQLSTRAEDILNNPEIEIVLELMGGYGFAKEVVLKALAAGKSVVTANKALLAMHSKEVFEAAYRSKGQLAFEASVGGGIPILRALREGLAGDRILAINGIINGTANFILTKMSQEGWDFARALKTAQELGYAEADPTFDVEGQDTAHKLTLLMDIAFNGLFKMEDMYVEGITGIEPIDIRMADEFGYVIKLLGKAVQKDGKYQGRVHPTLVSRENMLSSVNGSFNAIEVTGNFVGTTLHYGRGAGDHPTASAVVADVVDIVRKRNSPGEMVPPLAVSVENLKEKSMLPMSEIESSYYLRFLVQDKPGVLAQITKILGDHHISIQSMIQDERQADQDKGVPVIIFTHEAKEANMLSALSELDELSSVLKKTKLIRRN